MVLANRPGVKRLAVSLMCSLVLGMWGTVAMAAATDGDTSAQPDAAASETQPIAATPEDGATDQPDAAVESGPKVTTQQHADWLLECFEPAINGVNCQIKQRIVQNETEQNILVISIAYDPAEKTNVIQYILPLDFLLTPGVSIEIGDYQSVAGVNRCAAQGCFVEGTTDDAFITAMKAAQKGGRVVIVSRTGQKIGIGFSAMGFTKAYNQMVDENTRLEQAKAE